MMTYFHVAIIMLIVLHFTLSDTEFPRRVRYIGYG
jgi:ABC-type uncharacterized transport system permease subunit